MTAQPQSQEDLLTALTERLGRSQRRSAPFQVAGLIAVVVGLTVLTVQLNTMRQAAETRERAATEAFNESARTLANAKALLAAGDLDALRKELDVAELRAEANAQAAALPVAAPAVQVPTTSTPPAPIAPDFIAPPQSEPFRQEIYLQFAGLIQRSDVAAVNLALKNVGWHMQGKDGERTGAAAGLNEVRYSAEADRPAADALARALTAAKLGSGDVVVKQVRIIRPGTLEAWISKT